MGAFFLALEKVLKKIVDVCALIAGFMIIATTFVTVYGVSMRYFFRAPEPISYELATIFLLWGFLFAISFVEWKGEHIRADIFTPLMPKGLVTALNRIVGPCLALIYCFTLTLKGWKVAMYSLSINERSMSVWQEPLGPIKLMIPLGYGLLTLVVFRMLVRGINAYSSREAAREAA
jgi:TRAP-type C4-dicarboxylate transport system permease small subunit